MYVKRVGIIGAGPSGLTAIKACLEEGLEPFAFERENELGGVWVYRDVGKLRYPDGAAVYKCLKTNTSKAFFRFTDFPSPAEWTPFVSHDKCLKYFESYAHQFGLSKYISFDSEVVKVFAADDHKTTGRWRLRYRSSGEEHEDTFDAVVLCSGFYHKANLPQYPGLELFEGDVGLGNAYRENTKYTDKKVLVVGSGISAGEISIDLSFAAKQTFISTRRGFKVSAVIDSHGWPIDTYLGRRYAQSVIPTKFVQWLWRRESNKRFRLNELGLSEKSQNGCNPTSVIYNDNFVNQVLCGKILPKPKVERFTKNGAVFTDGTKIEDLDAILFCTGYSSDLTFVDKKIIPESTAERDLFLNVFPVHLNHHTLACVGFFKNFSVGSPITVIEMQTRWVARIFSGAAVLPSKAAMLEEIHTKRQNEHSRFGKDVFGIHAIKYMDRLATLIGCYPSLASLFLTDPRLSIHMFFSPVVPASYRLVGPHRWEGARETILNSWNTTFEGTHNKSAKQGNDSILMINDFRFFSPFFVILVVTFLLLLSFVTS